MADLFKLFKEIFCEQDIEWIYKYEDNEIFPFMLNKWFVLSSQSINMAREVDKYTFDISPKLFLALAWAKSHPKFIRQPYFKWVKCEADDIEFIFKKFQEKTKLSDNDMKHNKKYYEKDFNENKEEWFSMLGIEKCKWKKFDLDFDKSMKGKIREGKKGLALFGM